MGVQLTTVIRRGFKFPEGLGMAQSAHVGDQWQRSRYMEAMEENPDMPIKDLYNSEQKIWIPKPFIAVLAVNTFEELIMVRDHAVEENLNVQEWHDVIVCPSLKGHSMTAFVGISMGPIDSDKIKLVTHGLELW